MKFINSLKVILLVFLVSGVLGNTPASGQFMFMMENSLISKAAPDFTLNTLKADKVNLKEYLGDQSGIVFFWATWCPHCRVQLKELTKINDQLMKKGIKVVPVDVGESKSVVQKYIEKNKIPLNVFLDTESEVSEEYQIIGVPTLFFINKEGVVQAVKHSIPENYEEILLGSR